MSAKSDLKDLVLAKKADAGLPFDAIAAAVDALPDGDPDLQAKLDAALAQVADLQSQLDQVKATLAADDAKLADDEAKLAQIKQILGA